MTRRRLPIGLQTFRELREENCYYVDKTGFIARLLDEGKHYFLSRPRRFGKSLFLDTLKELFEGNEPLFAGLGIHDRWDWSVRNPVVRLDFGAGHFGEPGYVHASTMAQLAAAAQDAGVAVSYDTAPERFRELLRALHARTGQRAVVSGGRVHRQADPGRAGGARGRPRATGLSARASMGRSSPATPVIRMFDLRGAGVRGRGRRRSIRERGSADGYQRARRTRSSAGKHAT